MEQLHSFNSWFSMQKNACKSSILKEKKIVTTHRTIYSCMVIVLLLLTAMEARATTVTWTGGTGVDKDWTLGTNWDVSSAPVAGDDVVFNTSGDITFSILPASISYNSLTISAGNVTLAGATAMTFTIGGNAATDLVVASGASLTLATNANITVAAGSSADISGSLTINASQLFTVGGIGTTISIAGTLINNGTYNLSATTAVTTVTGTFRNAGAISNTLAARLVFSGTGTYEHAQDGGTIPFATWAVTSNCTITGIYNTTPSGLNQAFGNFNWNCPGQYNLGGPIDLGGQLAIVNGDLNIISTNIPGMVQLSRNTNNNLTVKGNFNQVNGRFGIGPFITGLVGTMTVNGNFNLEAGQFYVAPSPNGTGILNVDGDFTSAGEFNYSYTFSYPSTGIANLKGDCSITGGIFTISSTVIDGTLNLYGDFSLAAGATLTETYSGRGKIIFMGTGAQTFTSAGTISNTIDFTVNNGSTLQMGTGAAPSVLGGSDGTFSLSQGATLGITSPGGIAETDATGNIQVTGTRTFSTGANYIYNGESAQVTGTGLMQNTPAGLTINNSTGVTLSEEVTASGLVTLIAGTLNLDNYNLTAGSLTGSSDITAASGILDLFVGSDGTTPAAYSGIINNGTATSVGLTKTGAGTMLLSGTNTYTGATTISGGVLQLGSATAIADGSNVLLNGGTLSTGATTGYSETLGTIDLQSNSTIALASGSHSLTFSASNGVSWAAGVTLSIKGWVGDILTGGTAGNIFVGVGGLTDTQLAQITFYGYANGAGILPTGELVPVAIPAISVASSDPAVVAGNIVQNTTNNVIYTFDNTVTGGAAVISGLQVTTDGTYIATDITNLKAWYSADAIFSSSEDILLSTLENPGIAGTKTFPNWTSREIPVGTSNIFITADVPCAATAGNTINITAITEPDVTFLAGTETVTTFAGGSQTIQDAVPENVTMPSASIADAQSVLTWTNPGCFTEIMIVGKADLAVTGIPSGDGTGYTADLTYGSGTVFDGGYVVYKGTGSPQTVIGLTNGTTYYYTFFTRKGSTWSSGVTVSAVAIGSGNIDFQSAATGNWDALTTWQMSYDNGTTWIAATSVPSSVNDQVTIVNGHIVTVASGITVDQVFVNGQVSVSSGITLTVNDGADATDFTVNGTLINAGTVTTTAGTTTVNGTLNNTGTVTCTTATLVFAAGGIYQHSQNGGDIPAATWAVTSNCNITGVTNTRPTVETFNQTFGNFTWNCTNQSAIISLAGNLQTVRGNLTVTNTGTSIFVLGGFLGGNITIDGNYTQSGGVFAITYGQLARIMTVGGNFLLSNGTFYLSYDSGGGGIYMGTLNVAGNFSHTGGTIIENRTDSPGGSIVFSGAATQTYTSGGTVSGEINFTVNSGSTLQMAAEGTVISGGGTFTLSNGATLGITSANGITADPATLTGNIQTTIGRVFNTGSNYIYNGAVSQAAGTGLPLTVNNLTVANNGTSGNNIVTLSAAETVTANLSITVGILSLPDATTSSAATLTLGGAGAASGSWGSTGSGATNQSDIYFLSTSTGIVNISSSTLVPGTWFGGTSQDWSTDANWYGAAVPVSSTDVVIPLYATNQPEIANGVTAVCADLTVGNGASLTINEGGALTVGGDLTNSGTLTIESILSGSDLTPSGSLIVTGTSTGNITYKRQLKLWSDATYDSFDWHYFSSPVASGVAPADNAANAGKIDGVWLWNEASGAKGAWESTTSALTAGVGYNLGQTPASDGMISFTGTIVKNTSVTATSPYSTPAGFGDDQADYEARWIDFPSRSNYGGGGYNLLGNPFTSALRVSDEDAVSTNDYLSVNAASFDPNYTAVYVYDGSIDPYGIYNSIGISTGGEGEAFVQAGQGFFVLANNNNVTFSSGTEMQGHSVTTPMLKKSDSKGVAWPGLQLKALYGAGKVSATSILFNSAMTLGLDPGYDVGLISSRTPVEIYTHLVQDNGVNFTRQALPIPGDDGNIVSVGVDSENGGEVTFSGVIVPLEGYKFILEDRSTGKLTDLSTATYTVTIPAKTYGTGRFYIRITNGTQTTVDPVDPDLMNVRIWASGNKVIIKGAVGENATAEVYDIQGRKIYDNRLTDTSFNSFDLPSASKGVYIVVVKDGVKVYRQKVVMLQ